MDISRSVGRFRYVKSLPFVIKILCIAHAAKLFIYSIYHCVLVMYNTYPPGKKGEKAENWIPKGDKY